MTTTLPRPQRSLRDLAPLFRSPAPRRPRRRLALEVLEDRVMLADDMSHVAGLDTNGNLYVYGEIAGTADLDPGSQTYSVIGPTTYLAKYTPQKDLIWAKRADELFPEADMKIWDVASSSANGQDYIYVMNGALGSAASPGSKTPAPT